VRLRWNLWDRNLTRRRVAEATHEARALEARRDEARRVADLALVQAKDQVDAARGQWRLAVERAEVEARRLPLMEARWRNGAATEKEWLDATDDLRMAEVERALGAARLRLAENRLLAAAGL
jgi:outer membrane protein TolC